MLQMDQHVRNATGHYAHNICIVISRNNTTDVLNTSKYGPARNRVRNETG